jgi:hypothetical protein
MRSTCALPQHRQPDAHVEPIQRPVQAGRLERAQPGEWDDVQEPGRLRELRPEREVAPRYASARGSARGPSPPAPLPAMAGRGGDRVSWGAGDAADATPDGGCTCATGERGPGGQPVPAGRASAADVRSGGVVCWIPWDCLSASPAALACSPIGSRGEGHIRLMGFPRAVAALIEMGWREPALRNPGNLSRRDKVPTPASPGEEDESASARTLVGPRGRGELEWFACWAEWSCASPSLKGRSQREL